MNKTDLITKAQENIDIEVSKKDLGTILDGFTKAIIDEIAAGGKVQLVGFGTFEVSERAARTGRNPKDGSKIMIPASKTPKFKASKKFKETVNV